MLLYIDGAVLSAVRFRCQDNAGTNSWMLLWSLRAPVWQTRFTSAAVSEAVRLSSVVCQVIELKMRVEVPNLCWIPGAAITCHWGWWGLDQPMWGRILNEGEPGWRVLRFSISIRNIERILSWFKPPQRHCGHCTLLSVREYFPLCLCPQFVSWRRVDATSRNLFFPASMDSSLQGAPRSFQDTTGSLSCEGAKMPPELFMFSF